MNTGFKFHKVVDDSGDEHLVVEDLETTIGFPFRLSRLEELRVDLAADPDHIHHFGGLPMRLLPEAGVTIIEELVA